MMMMMMNLMRPVPLVSEFGSIRILYVPVWNVQHFVIPEYKKQTQDQSSPICQRALQ